MMDVKVRDLAELAQAAQTFVSEMGGKRVFTFNAPMGAGKTTFISAIARELGVKEDAVCSPTFAIVNEYRSPRVDYPIYHMDLYRIDSQAEVMDMGFEDYLASSGLCLIEWPEIVEDFLPDDTMEVTIMVEPDGTRYISTHPLFS